MNGCCTSRRLAKVYGQFPVRSHRTLVQTLREHVWVAPYYEDDIAAVKEVIGVEHLLFGSDWPHAEGTGGSLIFADDLRLQGFDEDEIHVIMNENGREFPPRGGRSLAGLDHKQRHGPHRAGVGSLGARVLK